MNKFVNNLLFAFGSQAISMISGMLVSLVLPKILGVDDFSYWQLFVFYNSYVGLFHFGLTDGLYLRYGGTKLKDMDNNLIGSQIKLMSIGQIGICAVFLCVLPFIVHDSMRQFVWICVCVFLIILNLMNGLGYIFQAGNETKLFSISTIISKLLFIIFVVILLTVFHNKNVKYYIIAFLLSHVIATSYSIYKGSKFVFSKFIPLKRLIPETFSNMKIGINMTISAIAGSLILGLGRALVDSHWNLTSFGVFSLAISLATLILQFISQISMVMFPALRQKNGERQIEIYRLLRDSMGIILCGVLIIYAPLKSILSWWLPNYSESLTYLGFILPICVFDGKMQMLYNTYLKVLRKERALLVINVVSCLISLALCLFSTYFINSIFAIIYSMIIAISIRSIISSIYLSRKMQINYERTIPIELLLCVIFVLLNNFTSPFISFCIYLLVYLIAIIMCKKQIQNTITQLKKLKNNKSCG